jgi:hypothetical protein
MKGFFEKVVSKGGYGDQYGCALKSARKTLTAAQIKLLYTTPQTLVPAPPAGSYIQIQNIVSFYDYAGAAFATYTTVEVRETNGSGTKVSADISSMLDQTADKCVETSGIEAQVTRLLTGQPIVACVATGNPTGSSSTGTLTIIVFYRVVKVY